MVNYGNGKIYKIIGPNPDEPVYVGSTTKPYLSQRMEKHRSDYKRWQNGKARQNVSSYRLFEKYGSENCKIILLEQYQANSRDELRIREQYYIDTLDCINKCKSYCTKEQAQERDRLYKLNNPEKIKERRRKEKIKNKEKYKAREQQDIHCDVCNCDVRIYKMRRHEKTQKHVNNSNRV